MRDMSGIHCHCEERTHLGCATKQSPAMSRDAGGDCFASLAMTLRSIHPQRLELAVQRRALHADELGGARDVVVEPADLRLEVFALERLARLAQRHARSEEHTSELQSRL